MREPAKRFQDSGVWHKAHLFIFAFYHMTETLSVTSQLRRSAISIAATIAEEFKKRGTAGKARFLNIAQGSLQESRHYLILAEDLEYCQHIKPLAILSKVS